MGESLFCVTHFSRVIVRYSGCLKLKMNKDRRQHLEGRIKCVYLSPVSICDFQLCVCENVQANVFTFR